jgi:LETM1 and EF-hand domain-containing protein 1, mitochondrial
LQVSEADGAATYKQKLEVIEEQEELIADEKAQEEVYICYSINYNQLY